LLLLARIRNVVEWKAILNAISGMIEDAMFICNSDGITLRGLDSSHVALADVTFPQSSFDKFEGKTSFFGIKLVDFKNVINSALDTDLIEIQISDHSLMQILINGSIEMEFHIKLLNNSEVNTPIPSVEYTSKVSLEPNTFHRILSNIQSVSEFVTINCKPTKIQFFGKSEAGDAKVDLEKGNSVIDVIRSSGHANAAYSLEYLMKISHDIGKTSTKMNFEYATKKPLHLQYELPSGAMVEYYLAPRAE